MLWEPICSSEIVEKFAVRAVCQGFVMYSQTEQWGTVRFWWLLFNRKHVETMGWLKHREVSPAKCAWRVQYFENQKHPGRRTKTGYWSLWLYYSVDFLGCQNLSWRRREFSVLYRRCICWLESEKELKVSWFSLKQVPTWLRGSLVLFLPYMNSYSCLHFCNVKGWVGAWLWVCPTKDEQKGQESSSGRSLEESASHADVLRS